jgi:hypothetical protein
VIPLLVALAGAAAPTPSPAPWLPLSGPRATVRLADGADPAALAPLLTDGRPIGAGADWLDDLLVRRPDLEDPRRMWRVPTAAVPALAAAGAIDGAWGLPDPAPPPYDIPPTTPDFDPEQRARGPAPLGVGAAWLRLFPGADGAGVRVFDVEYDYDPAHEALLSNPPAVDAGEAFGEYDFHGNAVLALVGSGADGFGISGVAPSASLRVIFPLLPDYDLAEAVLTAAELADAGDVLLIEQQIPTALGLGPVSADPATHAAIRVAVARGVTVVEPAGNGAVHLGDPTFDGWFDADNDSGAILVGAANVDGAPWSLTGYGARIDVNARVGDLIAPTTEAFSPDLFFPDRDRRQAYTSMFSGTSGAAALVAGACASIQGAARALHGAPLDPVELRAILRAAGGGHVRGATARPIGVPLDARRAIEAWIAP